MLWQIKTQLTKTDPLDRLKQLEEYLLIDRGCSSLQDITSFLNPPAPDLDITHSLPDLDLPSLQQALSFIKEAIKAGRPIIIYGDYDCDGVVATAILWEALYSLTPHVKPFIPSRLDHGYGLTEAGLTAALAYYPDQKPLIITVDNGIAAAPVVSQFPQLDFIITDHHQKGDTLPAAKFIVHTTKLSGAGVAWVLVSHLLGEPQPLDTLAIATVCDLLPLTGPNRSIVKHGLKALESSSRPGIIALKKIAGISDTPLSTYHLGYILGPRLNAAGRLGQGMDALRLLCTKNTAQAESLALLLNETNTDRQFLTQTHTQEAFKELESQSSIPPLIILESPQYHEGIIGLIAGKVLEKYNKPCLVLSVQKDITKGSARSPEGIDITSLLRLAGEGLIECGGHEQAAGLKLPTSNLAEFKTKLTLCAQDIDLQTPKTLHIDTRLDHSDLTFNLLSMLERFAPFGVHNPDPIFVSHFSNPQARLVGKQNNHLSLTLRQKPSKLSAIGFHLAHLYRDITPGQKLDIAYNLSSNTYMGMSSLQLQIKDLKSTQNL